MDSRVHPRPLVAQRSADQPALAVAGNSTATDWRALAWDHFDDPAMEPTRAAEHHGAKLRAVNAPANLINRIGGSSASRLACGLGCPPRTASASTPRASRASTMSTARITGSASSRLADLGHEHLLHRPDRLSLVRRSQPATTAPFRAPRHSGTDRTTTFAASRSGTATGNSP